MCMLKGLPAAFASAAFGTFLDQKRRGDFSTAACQTVLRLITILSDSYIDTTKKSVLGQLQATLGSQFVGESSGHEKSMLSLVREELLHFYQQVMTPDMRFTTLEPSLTSGVSFANLTSYVVTLVADVTLVLSLMYCSGLGGLYVYQCIRLRLVLDS